MLPLVLLPTKKIIAIDAILDRCYHYQTTGKTAVKAAEEMSSKLLLIVSLRYITYCKEGEEHGGYHREV